MASSVARMPMELINWAERGAACSFRRDLKDIAKYRPSRECVAFSCDGSRRSFCENVEGVRHSPPGSPCSTCSDASSVPVENLDLSSGCFKRQNSSIVDRWAESQARELFMNTVKRKAYDPELSAISSTAEPVSSRAAAFIHRDGSPATGSPTSATSSDCSFLDDIPSSARASSLIQLWREIEADAGQTPSGGLGRGENFSPTSKRDCSSGDESCVISESCDDSRIEREKLCREKSPESEKSNQSQIGSEDKESFSQEFLPGEIADGSIHKGSIHRFMRWNKIDILLARMRQERQDELDKLAEDNHVSRSSHRGWIQALLKFRHSDRLFAMAQKQFRDSTEVELDSLRKSGSKICRLREKFSPRNQKLVNNVGVLSGKGIPVISPSATASKGNRETAASQDEGRTSKENGILFGHEREAGAFKLDNFQDGCLNTPHQRCPVSPLSRKNFPDTKEIQELLQRKPVSTLLSGDFHEKMERLVLSLLQRQRSICEDEQLNTWQEDSAFPVMPLSFECQDDNQESCITSQPSNHMLEMEIVRDLRSDVAEIHHEVAELRKLLKHYVDEHSKLQGLIRDKVFCSVGISLALQASRWAPAKKAACCVCHEMQIDALLYRCGHMCACYSCAEELRCGKGICPVCASPIDDVVRALPGTNFPQ